MTGALKSRAIRHLERVLADWPRDKLRPECQLQDVLAKRIEKDPSSAIEVKQVNALKSLLMNRYQNKHRITGTLLQPPFNPKYYDSLIAELEIAPTRTLWDRIKMKVSGKFRL